MRISNKAEYACLVVLDLARKGSKDKPVALRSLSERKALPYKYLTQILLQLKAAGIVRSLRGWNGGYSLARPPSEISLWDVITSVQSEEDGVPKPIDGDRSSIPEYGTLKQVWEGLTELERRYLQERSFAELVEKIEGEPQPMFYL